MWPWTRYKYCETDRENQRLKAENDRLKAVLKYKPDYVSESRGDLLKIELSDAYKKITKMERTLELYKVFFARNEVKVFLKDNEVKVKDVEK